MKKFYILICLLLFVGCATMQLETNSKLTRTIVIDHSQLTNKTIYLQVTNTANSGGEKMNLNENIINSLKAKGYEIVDSSQKASYSLFVNVLFANNLKEARAIQTAVASGVFGGVGALASGSNGSNSLIVGAASKLLRRFERQYKPKTLMSFANLRWSTGALYEKLGFDLVSTTAPNYFYFKENENVLYPREKFQKHKLAELDGFDPRQTERQNMFNLGYRVIFDAGNKKYLKTYG
jgi:hypothetical protein